MCGSFFRTWFSIFFEFSSMYGGLLIIISNLSLMFLYKSVWINSIFVWCFFWFFFATFNAFVDISGAVIWRFLFSLFRVIAIIPEPVPMSSTFTFLSLKCLFIKLLVSSTRVSVSGLGIKTFLLTKNSSP